MNPPTSHTAHVSPDYHPFGMLMFDRSSNSSDYRYGFNGQEKDDEIKGEGNSINYKARIYDPRIARFLSVDPLAGEFAWYTPYQFAGNKPIIAIDLDGLEEFIRTDYYSNGEIYKSELTVVSWSGVRVDEEIVHQNRVDIDNDGVITVTYEGSTQKENNLRPEEVQFLNRRSQNKEGEIFQNGIFNDGQAIEFGALVVPNENESYLDDAKSVGENDYVSYGSVITIFENKDVVAPYLEPGLNATPQNKEDRNDNYKGGRDGTLRTVSSSGAQGEPNNKKVTNNAGTTYTIIGYKDDHE